MPTAQLVILCVTLLLLAAMLVVAGERRAEPAPTPDGVFDDLRVGDRVAVYTEGEQSVTGVVSSPPNGRLALSDAALVTGAVETKIGNARVPSERVQLVQVISRADPVPDTAHRGVTG